MAGTSPNSANIDRVSASTASATSAIVHPEYQYWRPDWRKLRDVLSGQREIKRGGELYLRAMKGMDAEDYDFYLDRATFYNMTAQTLNGMVGQVFHRDPIISNLPPKFKEAVNLSFGKDGSSHTAFCKHIVTEQVGMGRFGVLVDAPAAYSTTPASYVVGYAAENILDWTVSEVRGKFELTRVLLREFERESVQGSDQNPWIGNAIPNAITARKVARTTTVRPVSRYSDAYTYKTIYRELLLERQEDDSYVYSQSVYDEDPGGIPRATFVPQVRGKTLDFIPFKFFGAISNTPDVEKPPILDIADLNLSHYRTYAELEYGRTYTALPVYYAPGQQGDGVAEYHIGPNMVWEVPVGAEPGILEYKGEGLKALQTGLNDKERQIAAIGGRLMAGSTKSGSESDSQTALREANEQALILNVIQATEPGFAQVIRWWLLWRDVSLKETETLTYNMNRSFIASKIGARELRAIQLMYEAGLIPIETLYGYLVDGDVIDPNTSLEEFKAMMDDPRSFINNPNAQARQRGFDSRQQELDQVTVAREADLAEREIDQGDRDADQYDEELGLREREVVVKEKAPRPPRPKALKKK